MTNQRFIEWEIEHNPRFYAEPSSDEFIDRASLRHVICNVDYPDGVDFETFASVLNAVAETLDLFPYFRRDDIKPRWIPVSKALPELPDMDWTDRMVIVRYEQSGQKRVTVMIYERVVMRGKRTERWKWYWDRLVDKDVTITDWMPLPAP